MNHNTVTITPALILSQENSSNPHHPFTSPYKKSAIKNSLNSKTKNTHGVIINNIYEEVKKGWKLYISILSSFLSLLILLSTIYLQTNNLINRGQQ